MSGINNLGNFNTQGPDAINRANELSQAQLKDSTSPPKTAGKTTPADTIRGNIARVSIDSPPRLLDATYNFPSGKSKDDENISKSREEANQLHLAQMLGKYWP